MLHCNRAIGLSASHCDGNPCRGRLFGRAPRETANCHRFPAAAPCIILLLTIAGGRELWGFPKKLGQPTLRTEIDTLIGTLDYGPLRVATGTMGYKHREADLAQVKAALEEPNFLLKIIPHVDGSPRICELVEYHLEQLVLKGAWTGPAALALIPHALAPVADLPVLEIVSAIHIRADLTLGLGKVVHDYLQQPVQRSVRSYERSLVT
jgi:acetoacetate decarboxylase